MFAKKTWKLIQVLRYLIQANVMEGETLTSIRPKNSIANYSDSTFQLHWVNFSNLFLPIVKWSYRYVKKKKNGRHVFTVHRSFLTAPCSYPNNVHFRRQLNATAEALACCKLLVLQLIAKGQYMPACVSAVFLLPHLEFQKSCLISLQQEMLITAEHGTHKMEAAKTDVLMN